MAFSCPLNSYFASRIKQVLFFQPFFPILFKLFHAQIYNLYEKNLFTLEKNCKISYTEISSLFLYDTTSSIDHSFFLFSMVYWIFQGIRSFPRCPWEPKRVLDANPSWYLLRDVSILSPLREGHGDQEHGQRLEILYPTDGWQEGGINLHYSALVW